MLFLHFGHSILFIVNIATIKIIIIENWKIFIVKLSGTLFNNMRVNIKDIIKVICDIARM
jgi:hypothetical protein